MGQNSKIQWTVHTANLWWGCTEVHDGCDHCYARVYSRAKGKGDAWDGVRYAVSGIWANLQKWQRAAAKLGKVHEVFTGSMMDIFEKSLPAVDWQGRPLGITTGDIRNRFFREIVPACPNLLFQLLTKRPGNAPKMVPSEWLKAWPKNVITGASVVDQPTADTLIPQLHEVPGPKFLSCEPLLGEIEFETHIRGYQVDHLSGELWSAAHARRPARGIDWVIVGGESGGQARRCDLAWIRSIRDQCRAAGVPCFVKQLGACATDPPNGVAGRSLRVHPDAADLVSLRLRDGHGGDPDEWPPDLRVREFPALATEGR